MYPPSVFIGLSYLSIDYLEFYVVFNIAWLEVSFFISCGGATYSDGSGFSPKKYHTPKSIRNYNGYSRRHIYERTAKPYDRSSYLTPNRGSGGGGSGGKPINAKEFPTMDNNGSFVTDHRYPLEKT